MGSSGLAKRSILGGGVVRPAMGDLAFSGERLHRWHQQEWHRGLYGCAWLVYPRKNWRFGWVNVFSIEF